MKKIITTLLLLACFAGLRAQVVYDPTTYCTGWHNPSNFTFTGGDANTAWEGFVITAPNESSYYSLPTCANGVPWWGGVTAVAANNLTSQTSSSCSGVPNAVDFQNNNIQNRRFAIMGPGTDPGTGNHLTHLPYTYNGGNPDQPVEGYTTSIRLGNYCWGGEREALRFSMDVMPNNALLTVYYAMSLENSLHSEYSGGANPSFTIRVEIQDDNTGLWSSVGGDTLCYIQPAPLTSSSIPGSNFYYGSTGTQSGSGDNVYSRWNKVVIPLYNYLYRRVRLTMTAGDCAYSAHYGCCYFAGDCEPMAISGSGCSSGENDTVTVLTAPAGMISYQWYKNTTTHVLSNTEASNLANLEAIPGATGREYCVRARDFAVRTPGIVSPEGAAMSDTTYLPQTTIVCASTSLMNLNQPTLTITSYLNTSLGNTKPTIRVDTLLVGCDNNITLRNTSMALFTVDDLDRVDTMATVWEFYNSRNPLRNEMPVATYTGPVASHTYDTPGAHSFKIKVSSYQLDMNGDPACWNKTTIPIRTMNRPNVTCVFDSIICSGEEVLFSNTTTHEVDGRTYQANPQNGNTWHFWDGQELDSTVTSYGSTWSMKLAESTDFTLTTYVPNIYWLHDTTGDGIPERIYCYNTGQFHVRAEQFPELTVLGDTIVCEGQLSTVQVQSDVPVNRYKWCTRLDSNFVVQTGNTMQEVPQGDKTYYVMAATPNNCITWDSLSIRLVNPVLTVPVTQMCDGEFLYLYGTGASTYTWEASPFDNSMEASPNGDTLRVSPIQSTQYTMVGHGTNGCNADPKRETITVFHYPEMAFEMTPDFIDSEKPQVTFKDVSRYAVRSLWDFGNGNTSTERQLTKTFTTLTEDSIYITLTSYNELNCYNDTAFYVPVSLFAVWFPTAFTPTLSTNRTFHLFTHNDLEYFSIYIYDRRGDLVFYSTDQNFEWDGKHNGRYCDQGTFVYVCNYRRPGTTDIVTRKGTVLMLQ